MEKNEQKVWVLTMNSASDFDTTIIVEVYATREAAQEAMRQIVDGDEGLRKRAEENEWESEEVDGESFCSWLDGCYPEFHESVKLEEQRVRS